jgi:hypothetical protein
MAQTRRKRKRRHRGTQAGTIDRAGRTSKPASSGKSSAKKPAAKSTAKLTPAERRQQRLDTAPTWRGALNRAAFAAAILVIFVAIVQKDIAQAVLLGAFALLLYVPMSYYTDLWLYRRRQRQKQRAGR